MSNHNRNEGKDFFEINSQTGEVFTKAVFDRLVLTDKGLENNFVFFSNNFFSFFFCLGRDIETKEILFFYFNVLADRPFFISMLFLIFIISLIIL